MQRRSLVFAAALAVVTVLSAAPAAARCMGTWLHVAAADVPIPPNGRVLLEGFGREVEASFAALGSKKPALVSGADVVPLNVLERRTGDFRLTQVLLEPSRPLLAGRSYRVRFDGAPAGEPLTVKVAGATDNEAPRWTAAPTVDRAGRTELGCGPAVQVTVKMPVTDDGAYLLAHVTLSRADGSRTVEGFVPVEQGVAVVGHGMCSGLFELETGVKYVAHVAVVDGAGRSAKAPGAALTFTAP